jgi:glutaminase
MDEIPAGSYVSTGALPSAERVRRLVEEAYECFRENQEGELSDVYPASA